MKRRSLLGPHREDQPNGLLHLTNAGRRPRREFPAILAVFGLEIAGTDAEGQPPSADQIDSGGDLGQMCRIAIADRGGERRQTNTAGHCHQCRQDGPALHKGLIRRADTADLEDQARI
jgi:hypothetical protein